MISMKMGCGRSFVVASFLIAILSGIGIKQGGASVHEYSDAQFTKMRNGYFSYGGREGHWASVTGGESFIRFDPSLQLKRTNESASRVTNETEKVTVEAVIFEVGDIDIISGYYPSHGKNSEVPVCCTKDVAKSMGCQPGEVIISKHSAKAEWQPHFLRAYFTGHELTARFPVETIPITKKGLYYVIFVFCEPELEGLTLSGKIIWKNPGGYLPGNLTHLNTFCGLMSLAYLTLAILWLLQYVRHWKEILQVQHFITAFVALGMCEMMTSYFYYALFNSSGKGPGGLRVWGVTLSAIKRTAFRLLIVVVSMGYGIVPTLDGLTTKVIVLVGATVGATYFAALEAFDIFDILGRTVKYGPVHLVLWTVVSLDVFFFFWTFISLYMTMGKLRARKQYANLKQYRRFTYTLAFAFIFAVVWIGYELYLKVTDRGELWESASTIVAFWDLFNFVLLSIICALWAPSQNSTWIAYSKDVGEDCDEEAVALTTSRAVAENETNSIKGNRGKPINSDVSSIE